MLVPVNLYVDRMSPVQPVRVADVYALTQERGAVYREAAAKIGLTVSEYTEFREALNEDGAVYGPLPRRIDAMAGVHRRSGHVYALRNVLVPNGTMGWKIALADGTTVIVPNICGNLSMNRSRVSYHAPIHRTPVAYHRLNALPVAVVVPVAVPVTPVSFAPDAPAPTVAVPIAAAGVAHAPNLSFLAPLVPLAYGLTSGGSNTPVLPLCSGGSNEFGACRP